MSEQPEGAPGKKSWTSYISRYIPAIQKPLYKQGFNTRLKWTGLALALYLVLANITVIGISPTSYERFKFLEIVLGSRFGSLMTLGIGPIVTAGIILQLLVGSKIINWDMSKPESKKKFQFWNKFFAIIFSFIEAFAFVLAGALGPIPGGPFGNAIVIMQLAMGGILVILLDDLISKWGFGSGISLFIAAGVGSQIFVQILSPLASGCTAFDRVTRAWIAPQTCIPNEAVPPSGLLWNGLGALLGGRLAETVPTLWPIAATVITFVVVVYIQHIHVEVPLAFSALRGFGKSWNLKLLYTSNIPVILAGALLANFQLMAQMSATVDPVTHLKCGIMGCFDANGNAPISGLIYFLSAPPRGLPIQFLLNGVVPLEILRGITYIIMLTVLATIFSVFWVSTSGMDAKSVAGQIESAGMQIPGYRRDPRVVESVLNRYIPALAVLGGITIGLVAGFADLLGAVGTGTGILLTVMIVYNYYEELKNQNLEEAHPLLRKILGG